MWGQDDPQPNDVEYYYDDKQDESLKSRVDEHYSENYEEEVRKVEANKTARPVVQFGMYTPELRDYTLREEFRDPFKAMPQVSMHGLNLALGAYCLLLVRLINNKQPMGHDAQLATQLYIW